MKTKIKKGDRLKLISPIINSDSTWMPIEKDMPVGLEGSVVDVSEAYGDVYIAMKWDNGRTLSLFGSDKCYELIN